MRCLDLSFDSPEENLACDEALIEACAAGEIGHEVIRFWESPRPFAVVGYGGKVAGEVDLAQCRRDGLPVLRRVSGGGSVLQGPGCLNLSLLLRIEPDGPLASITGANSSILSRTAGALRGRFHPELDLRGPSDLAIGDLKVSGNAQRRKRHWLLFHGTLLHDYDLARIDRTLLMPPRQPDYRNNRPHREFVTNGGFPPREVRRVLLDAWEVRDAMDPAHQTVIRRVEELVATRYGRPEWNHRF